VDVRRTLEQPGHDRLGITLAPVGFLGQGFFQTGQIMKSLNALNDRRARDASRACDGFLVFPRAP
jgi:hypothetical protein